MKTQTIYVDACTSTGIAIGRRNTYATEQIVFGLAQLVQQYGAGSAVLMVLRPTDTTPYPAVTSQSGTELTWTVSATDTSITGTGECELYWYVDGGLAKSVIFPLTIQRDIVTEPIDEPPEPYQTWVDDLTDLGAETLQNAQAAAQSATDAETAQGLAEDAKTAAETAQGKAETAQGKAETAQEKAETAQTAAEAAADRAEDALEEFTTPTASATTLDPDDDATASYANGHFTFGIPKGDAGDVGATPDFSIGTVQTLQPSQPATASITGTRENPVLNLGIPKGEQGDPATNLVQSVNGKTGAVVLDSGDIAYESTTVEEELSEINSALTSLSAVTEIIDTASGAIASFPDGSGLPMRSLVAQINPVQDLHGQSNPWPAGGGKNKLQATSSSATVHDVTFTVNSDGSVMANGTADSTAIFDVGTASLVAGSYYISGSVGGSGETYYIRVHANGSTIRYAFDGDNSFTLESDTTVTVSIYVLLNVNVSNKMFYPMIRPTSVSDATFAPYSNVCPISGWTGLSGQRAGKNLFDKTAYTKSGWLLYAENPFKKMDVGASVSFSINKLDSEAHGFSVTVNEDATVSPAVATLIGYTFGNTTLTTTFTISQAVKDCPYIRLNGNWNGLTADMVDNAHFQIEISASPTPYEEYQGEPISVSFGTTVYGGTDEVVSGNGTSTMGMVDLGALTWAYNSTVKFFQAEISNVAPVGYTEIPNAICSMYATGSIYTVRDGSMIGFALNQNGMVYIRDPAFTDTATFKTAMSGQQLVYTLATPQTFTHDPQEVDTLVGQNNVFVDTGNVEVTYPADTKLYIDKKIAEALA